MHSPSAAGSTGSQPGRAARLTGAEGTAEPHQKIGRMEGRGSTPSRHHLGAERDRCIPARRAGWLLRSSKRGFAHPTSSRCPCLPHPSQSHTLASPLLKEQPPSHFGAQGPCRSCSMVQSPVTKLFYFFPLDSALQHYVSSLHLSFPFPGCSAWSELCSPGTPQSRDVLPSAPADI